jgi:HEPN domain-containing protein
MKAITREWLSMAADDLSAAEVLISQEHLTNMVAFHAQQAVEKALKAVIEELELGLIKTHSLTRLYEMVRDSFPVVANLDMLDRLEAVYIEARYPGEMGLLPTGKPTTAEAAALLGLARDVYQRIQAGLESALLS